MLLLLVCTVLTYGRCQRRPIHERDVLMQCLLAVHCLLLNSNARLVLLIPRESTLANTCTSVHSSRRLAPLCPAVIDFVTWDLTSGLSRTLQSPVFMLPTAQWRTMTFVVWIITGAVQEDVARQTMTPGKLIMIANHWCNRTQTKSWTGNTVAAAAAAAVVVVVVVVVAAAAAAAAARWWVHL